MAGEFEDVRRGLAARLDSCWDRLEDAISELYAVHEVEEAEIMARVSAAIEAERTSG